MSNATAVQVKSDNENNICINTETYLDDVELAKSLLENANQNGGKLRNSDIVFSLRNFLKMKYYPVAVKYFFSQDELEDFKKNVGYKIAYRALDAGENCAGWRCLLSTHRRNLSRL